MHIFSRKQSGQVALFVAIIFQVLFVFFAMIVNVGLLVHHKINLQNSVDLAAYYGAMKQAEMMNAIGHVNYQIRQSWKLLNFRYNQLGTAGAINSNPYNGNQIIREDDIADPRDYSFCTPYTPNTSVNNNESYCQSADGFTVVKPGVPAVIGGFGSIFFGFQAGIAATALAIKNKAESGCQAHMAHNWMQLAEFLQIYKMDIRNRKKLLLALANKLSVEKPTDIDGESIKKGVYSTLVKNLTYQNQESLKSTFSNEGEGGGGDKVDFKYYNSLSDGSCGSTGNEIEAPKWLSEIYLFPIYQYLDAECSSGSAISFKSKYFNLASIVQLSQNVQQYYPSRGISLSQLNEIAQIISEIPSNDPNTKLFRTSAGFEKNPWCVTYTGVSATVTPKIPFSPLGDITLKAKAFAKPFGGRIGPWYAKNWNPTDDKSDMSAATNETLLNDKLLPLRIEASTAVGAFDPGTYAQKNRLYPNFSRYLGDEVGQKSELTRAHFEKAIHEQRNRGMIDLNWYNHPFDEDWDQKGNGAGDPVAWDKLNNKAPALRDVEIASVAPDQFDIASYSIDPDFYNNYLKRIEKGYPSLSFLLRGDLGSRMNGSDAEKRFSIRDQIAINKDASKAIIDSATKLTYFINRVGQVLTGWQQVTPDSYILDQDRFGKCGSAADDDKLIKADADEKETAAGSCKAGGRTGYSVKLVDGKFLKNEVNGKTQSYELGGKGVTGSIKNPPPSNF